MARKTIIIALTLVALLSCVVVAILSGDYRYTPGAGSEDQAGSMPSRPDLNIRADLFVPALVDDVSGDERPDLLVLGQERSGYQLAVYDGIKGGLIWKSELARSYPRSAVRDIAGHVLVVTAGTASEGWDLRTGKRLWSITLPEPLLETGDGSLSFVADTVIVYHLYSNVVVGIDLQTGKQRWQFQGGEASITKGSRTPRTSRGQQVGGYLCFPADGTVSSQDSSGEVRQSCYDLSNGESIKRVTFEAASEDYALRDGSQGDVAALFIAKRDGSQLVVERIGLAEQQVLSRYILESDPDGSLRDLQVVHGDDFTAVVDSGPLFILKPSAAALAVEQPEMIVDPLAFDGTLLYAAVYPERGQHPVKLAAIDAEDASVRWTSDPLEIDGQRRWHLLPGSGMVVTSRGDGDGRQRQIALLDADGAQRWALSVSQSSWAGSEFPQLIGRGNQLFVVTDERIHAVDPENGELLWSIGES